MEGASPPAIGGLKCAGCRVQPPRVNADRWRDGGSGKAGRERVTMIRTKCALLMFAGVLIVTVVYAQGFQLAITDEQLHQAARDAGSPPAGWVFGDACNRSQYALQRAAKP